MLFTLLQSGATNGFDWNMLLFGEHSWHFIWEVMLRSFIMFCVSVATLRLLGKRGVKQRLFEIAVIITLGSAAGDAMFYKDVGLIPAIFVFIMIIILYKITSWLVAKNKWFDSFIEGQPELLINEGAFNFEVYKKQLVAQDEFFAELRLKSISQMGQVKRAYLEDSGEISIFYYEEDEVKYGMPVMPVPERTILLEIPSPGIYSCNSCGYTEDIRSVGKKNCAVCSKEKWVRATNEKRVK